MEDEKWLEAAQETYRFLIDTFNRNDFPYEEDPEKLTIVSITRKDDLDIPFSLIVKPYNNMVTFLAPLYFDVPDDMQVEMAVAVCTINQQLKNGCFKYSSQTGEIVYFLYNHYVDSPLSEEDIFYMLGWSFSLISEYNNLFQDLSSGDLSLEQFMDILKIVKGGAKA